MFAEIARGAGNYQPTRNGKTLVWNATPKAGDEATWSGARDREGYARGFGTLIWYTSGGADKPQLYARYWGNMDRGKFNGLVNVHSKKKTHHALFADGARLTRWAPGPSRSRMTQKQIALVTKHNEAAGVRVGEPEPAAPAAGPEDETAALPSQRSGTNESVQDLWSERWPKIDIDDSLRVLALPPRSLRLKR
ncbi:MAG TPA: hypothetical protein VIU85_02130 [Chthoniobacterales bacterium]